MKEYNEKTHIVISRKVANTHKVIMYLVEMSLWVTLSLLAMMISLWSIIQVTKMFIAL